MPESDCPGSFQLPLAWAYNLTGDFCHFFCLDKRHFITEFGTVGDAFLRFSVKTQSCGFPARKVLEAVLKSECR